MSNLCWINRDVNVKTGFPKSLCYGYFCGNILRNQFWCIDILAKIKQGGMDLRVSQLFSSTDHAFSGVASCNVASRQCGTGVR